MRLQQAKWRTKRSTSTDRRLEVFRYFLVVFACVIAIKLFFVQVFDYQFYKALANGQREIFRELIPERGTIYLQDFKDKKIIPIATNEQRSFIYADPRLIEDPKKTVEALSEVFGYDEDKRKALEIRLSQKDDPYEPIQKEINDVLLAKLEARALKGIFSIRKSARIYPDIGMSGHVVGFLGSDQEGKQKGRYGIEGYFNEELTGTQGFLRGERDTTGGLIPVGNRSVEQAVDGADIVLTLDRTIQFMVCKSLKEAIASFEADGGSVVVVEPATGNILAMCGVPDFDSNNYSEVKNINQFNNPAIFESYEPGSIFKPLTMAAAIDVGAVTPSTKFEDTGSTKVEGWNKPLGNAEGKIYGEVDMTRVLEDSINTGMIFVMRQMGRETFIDYVKRFGFGAMTGIELETEQQSTIDSLTHPSEIYAATASFGQGITVTPLQIVMAYAAIANGGVLKRPQIVDEIRRSDGRVEKRMPQDVTRVIDEKTARTIAAMLVSVVDYGHGKRAGVPGYYIGGKTGTAQVARADGIGYDQDSTIGSFAGFGPVEDPRFAMIVRIDNPKGVKWAESTAAPLFGKIAEFLLEYYEVEPVRK